MDFDNGFKSTFCWPSLWVLGVSIGEGLKSQGPSRIWTHMVTTWSLGLALLEGYLSLEPI